MEPTRSGDYYPEEFDALHSAKRNLIRAESSEKIGSAQKCQVRTYIVMKDMRMEINCSTKVRNTKDRKVQQWHWDMMIEFVLVSHADTHQRIHLSYLMKVTKPSIHKTNKPQ